MFEMRDLAHQGVVLLGEDVEGEEHDEEQLGVQLGLPHTLNQAIQQGFLSLYW